MVRCSHPSVVSPIGQEVGTKMHDMLDKNVLKEESHVNQARSDLGYVFFVQYGIILYCTWSLLDEYFVPSNLKKTFYATVCLILLIVCNSTDTVCCTIN